MLIASRLFKGCKEALKECERLNRDEIIDKYVSSWWKFDSMVLELSNFDFERESPLITPAYVAYETYLDRVNRRLLEAVKNVGWKQNQSSFWSYVTRAEKPVAVFFTDALRFDLAKKLIEKLQTRIGVEEVKVEWLYGVLPSITEVGMAALLPDALLSLAFDNSLKVSIGNKSVTDKSERVAYGLRFAKYSRSGCSGYNDEGNRQVGRNRRYSTSKSH
ncbi:PglZ domain-containing protein [Methanophagales archaeon]|nr:MAG: PglZ domain-containing protein [Methanophagales archaeon]